MTGGRKRGSVRHKGWLHRNRHRGTEAPPSVLDTEEEHAPQPDASLDQVLRRAAEARKAADS